MSFGTGPPAPVLYDLNGSKEKDVRRWNGWGDDAMDYPVPAGAADYLSRLVGVGTVLPEADLAAVLAAVPVSRLRPHPLLVTEAEDRLRHARGQSLPDWIALRSGRIGVFPDGVAYPASDENIRALLAHAHETGTRLIPYGGGSSVVGHINPLPGDAPTLTVDLTRLNRLTALDETSRLATFEAGALGPQIETQLNARGYTLGHFPQSFEGSTLGGWIAARSSGQQSYYYGRIEDLFAGGHVETPLGSWELPPLPASAAGPDLRQVILGSEGRFGVITRAVVRIRPLPETESFHGVFFRDWESGVQAARELAQAGVGVSMLRLSNALETETTLKLAGHERLVAWAEHGLRLAGYGPQRCLMLFGLTGNRREAAHANQQTVEVARAHGGLVVGEALGKRWAKTRFRAPYLRNTLWELGYALDTLETALPWSAVLAAAEAIPNLLRDGLAERGERVLAFAHLSHLYADGASLYVTYLYRRAADPDETLQRWQALKGAASREIVAHGGTISHQHGVGRDHAPYLAAEKGALGLQVLESIRQTLDPERLMNPGKLLSTDGAD